MSVSLHSLFQSMGQDLLRRGFRPMWLLGSGVSPNHYLSLWWLLLYSFRPCLNWMISVPTHLVCSTHLDRVTSELRLCIRQQVFHKFLFDPQPVHDCHLYCSRLIKLPQAKTTIAIVIYFLFRWVLFPRCSPWFSPILFSSTFFSNIRLCHSVMNFVVLDLSIVVSQT